MLKINSLTKTYYNGGKEINAAKDINLHVGRGEIFGIIGFSGAGKSTLIKCLNMLEAPTSGSIKIDGQEITTMNSRELRAARTKIGMIFQHFNLLSSRTVFDNICFPLEIAGVPAKDRRSKANHLLSLVGLEDKALAYPAQLSGGQKQRVGIARALANDPKVLLCDEATSALDPQTTESILALIKSINRELNLTVLLITHEMRVVTQICDRVAVMEDGRVIEEGKVLEVFTSPKHETTKQFVGSVINTNLPQEIIQAVNNNGNEADLIRVSFVGSGVTEPLISTLVRECSLDTNILYANVDYIQQVPFGVMALQLKGPLEKRKAALSFLQEKGFGIEVINHVS